MTTTCLIGVDVRWAKTWWKVGAGAAVAAVAAVAAAPPATSAVTAATADTLRKDKCMRLLHCTRNRCGISKPTIAAPEAFLVNEQLRALKFAWNRIFEWA